MSYILTSERWHAKVRECEDLKNEIEKHKDAMREAVLVLDHITNHHHDISYSVANKLNDVANNLNSIVERKAP